MPAPQTVLDLVSRFGEHVEAYKAGAYNETQVRRDFLDPFFKALGWDMDNTSGYAEAYRDVIHEDQLKVAGGLKAPDYGFRIGGQRKFFLEAKKPAVHIKESTDPAYQLRRYAWSAKLPLSILSDFEEFAIYDCRQKPSQGDPASKARIFYCTYDQYPTKWDEICGIFSKDAILKGSFDKFAATTKAKRGTAEVDADFLGTIERWRADLARNLALRNPELTQRHLNFAVQTTLDRIIFLRICEDRGIEDYERLAKSAQGKGAIYPRLVRLFHQADDRYNSGLFHFRAEKGRHEQHDSLTPGLVVDDELLRKLIAGLYYPDSPYEFSVLGADILGQVYEQFLGKVIRLTSSHRAVVEDKPEVKKAGGVYYTPTYIVDYMVHQALGPLTEDKTAAQIARVRVLDPACGSGSFLIAAYQFLLDWHLRWYTGNDPEKWTRGRAPVLVAATRGGWRLSTAERKRILLAHIYGADIDAQAVEVTKLSLLLKVLEGETAQTVQRELIQARVLPDLGDNIKCGNSIVAFDFYTQPGLPMLTADARLHINAFDWAGADGFPEIMKAGGFDVVIGNPPYVDIKGMPEWEVRYLFNTYSSANNRINLFAVFMERTLALCRQSTFRHSMIVPTALLTQESYRDLRQMISSRYRIAKVVRLPNEPFGSVVGAVKVDTVIVVLGEQESNRVKGSPRGAHDQDIEVVSYAGYDRIRRIDPSSAHVRAVIPQPQWSAPPDFIWSLNTDTGDDAILRKTESRTVPLERCVEFCLGLTPYDKHRGHSREQIEKQVFHATHRKNASFTRLLAGNDVGRYWVRWNGARWISYGPWLGAPREARFFTERRILVKQIIDWGTRRIWATIAEEELYNTQNAFNLLPREQWNLNYVLGVINSRLMTFYHRKRFLDEFKMRFQKVLIKDARRFPIHVIDPTDTAETAAHDQIVALVDQMLDLHRRRPAVVLPHEQEALDREIAAVDERIDHEVYTLYGLTPEEIRLVDSAGPVLGDPGEAPA